MKAVVSLKTFMSWISTHLNELIVLAIAGLAQLASYLHTRWEVKSHTEKIKKNEETLEDHLTAPKLHRTPDFEQKIDDIKADVNRIHDKLDRALAQRHR